MNDFDTAMRYYTDDTRVRFGNGPFVVGRDAVRDELVAKHSTFRSLTHEFHEIWDVGRGLLVLEADISFTRHDGTVVRTRAAGFFRHRGRRWTQQLHFGDTSPVFTVEPARTATPA